MLPGGAETGSHHPEESLDLHDRLTIDIDAHDRRIDFRWGIETLCRNIPCYDWFAVQLDADAQDAHLARDSDDALGDFLLHHHHHAPRLELRLQEMTDGRGGNIVWQVGHHFVAEIRVAYLMRENRQWGELEHIITDNGDIAPVREPLRQDRGDPGVDLDGNHSPRDSGQLLCEHPQPRPHLHHRIIRG